MSQICYESQTHGLQKPVKVISDLSKNNEREWLDRVCNFMSQSNFPSEGMESAKLFLHVPVARNKRKIIALLFSDSRFKRGSIPNLWKLSEGSRIANICPEMEIPIKPYFPKPAKLFKVRTRALHNISCLGFTQKEAQWIESSFEYMCQFENIYRTFNINELFNHNESLILNSMDML
jgi:hypothetical protein